jgi:hypothetical protein
VLSVVAAFPPTAVLAAFVGLMYGALFHLLFGRGFRQLGMQLLLGTLGGIIGAVVGSMIPPAVLAIGDTNLIATTICAWLALGIARIFRFC